MTKIDKEKMRKRHKKISQLRKQRRLRFTLTVLALGLLFIGALKLYYSGMFNVKKVKVTGNQHLNAGAIVKLAGVTSKTSLLRLPVDKIKKRILKQMWIKNVYITRRFPDTLEIRVVERKPIAAIAFKDCYALVDKSYVVLEYLPPDKEPDLPKIKELRVKKPAVGGKISSKSLSNATKCLSGLDSDLKSSLNYILAPSIELFTLITKDDVEILYGEATQVEKKNQVIKEIFKKKEKRIIFIDVRVVSNPVIRTL